MDEAYGADCLSCGRTLGYVYQGTFFARPGPATLERDGKRYRCGYCHGSILFQPDPSLKQPDWIAAMKKEEAASGNPRRAYRKRAG
jgi:DNA-directed RNA polymerase subunit RPC12/RpoP